MRNILPDNFLLLPGVGAQGANISEVINSCTNSENKKILINVSRSIIYAGNDENFVLEAVKKLTNLITRLISNKKDCYREVTALYN